MATNATASPPPFGQGFLRDIWWFAVLSDEVRPGSLKRYELLGEPVLIGRTKAGEVFAMRDICPHRAAPLSAGRVVDRDGEGETVECPYHGWRFRPDGGCAAIPSLTGEQDFDVARIRVRSYPARESQGLVFVWMGSDPRLPAEPDHEPPVFPGVVGGGPKLVERMDFDAHVDHAVVGLMDPAHGPYVHKQWWWRTESSQHEKSKAFEPRELGFAMARHAPSSNSRAYKLLGGKPATEIVFRLPALRWEPDHHHPDLLVRPLGVRPRQALPAHGRGGLPQAGRRHGEPAERGPALRPRPDLDRRRRQTGQVVPGPQARMVQEPLGSAVVRESGRAGGAALAELTRTERRGRAPMVSGVRMFQASPSASSSWMKR